MEYNGKFYNNYALIKTTLQPEVVLFYWDSKIFCKLFLGQPKDDWETFGILPKVL